MTDETYMNEEDLHELRRQAIADLINTKFDTLRARFADHVGIKRSYVTRMLKEWNEPTRKAIGEKVALDIENMCNLETGSLLYPRGKLSGGHPLGSSLDSTGSPRTLSQGARVVWTLHEVEGQLPPTADTTKGLHGAEYAMATTLDPKAFLFRVRDDTMAPRFNRGEYVLVEPGVKPEIEDEVLVRTTEGKAVLARLVSRKGGGFRLGFWGGANTQTLDADTVSWVYPVAHYIAASRVKS